MFNPVDTKTDFVAMGRRTLDWRERNNIPAKYRARKSGSSYSDNPLLINTPT